MNCYLYCRKSSEDKSRQIQSIDDQKKVMLGIAKIRGLKITKIFTDEKSAGKPYQRPAFEEMMKRIHKENGSIILSWKIDRLSRNPIENGQLSWLLQKGLIREIIVSDRRYLPQDNVLLFMMEGAMANQYLRDLSTNVKRGMNSKVEKGVFPGCAPIGYKNGKNDRGEKTINPNSKYFSIIQKLWNLLLTGNYQLADLYRLMEKKYPLFNKEKLIAFSTFHRIFQNPFYCGLFRWRGELHLGVHKKMITQNEFDLVQNLLKKTDKTRKRDLEFDYKGIFVCGNCKACVSADRKTKFIIAEQKEKSFDYYRCTHKKKAIKCKEKPLSKKQITNQLQEKFMQISLPNEILDFGIKKLSTIKVNESELQENSLYNIKREIQSLKSKKEQIENNLVLESDIDIRAIMKRKYNDQKIKIQRLNENYNDLELKIENWNQDIIKTLNDVREAQKTLKLGTKEDKKRLLNDLGTNWVIQGQKIDYEAHFVIKAIIETKKKISPKMQRFEPTNSQLETGETLSLEQVNFVWLTLWELIRNSK